MFFWLVAGWISNSCMGVCPLGEVQLLGDPGEVEYMIGDERAVTCNERGHFIFSWTVHLRKCSTHQIDKSYKSIMTGYPLFMTGYEVK